MKRVGAVVVLATLALACASAAAGPAITASVAAPGDGDVLSGTVEVQGAAHAAAGVRRIEISIDSFGVASKQLEGLQQDASTGYSWDTNQGSDASSILPNGEHKITVHAVAVGGAEDSASIDVQTDNPPVAPGGLEVAGTGGAMKLTWSPNPEPDVLGYAIERDSGSGFVGVGETTGTEFSENLVAGTYAYRVIARRSSPNSADGIASSPSEAVSIAVASAAGGGSGSVTKLTSPGRLGAKAYSRKGAAGHALAALLSGSAPVAARLPRLPSLENVPWGSFDKNLPYGGKKPQVPAELDTRLATSSSGLPSVVPPDGLRWVAAGLLLLVCAALSRVLATGTVEWNPDLFVGSLRAWFTAASRRP